MSEIKEGIHFVSMQICILHSKIYNNKDLCYKNSYLKSTQVINLAKRHLLSNCKTKLTQLFSKVEIKKPS